MTILQIPKRVRDRVQHPHPLNQLLFKPGTDAYYSAAEWADNTHRLADRRDGVGDLRMPRTGRCWLFDGVDDYGEVAGSVAQSTDFTLAIRFKPTAVKNHNLITYQANWSSFAGGAYLYVSSGNTLALTVLKGGTEQTIGIASVAQNTWNDIVVIKSGLNVTTFIGGSVVNSSLSSDMVFPASGVTKVGRGHGSDSLTFIPKGSVKDVRIYAEALTTGNAKNIISGNWLGSPSLYLPCEEESGYTGFDASGNGNHVTLSGITPSTFHATDKTVPTSRANEDGHSHTYRIEKTAGTSAWGDGGFASSETIAGDGYIEWVHRGAWNYVVGFSGTNADADRATIQHGLYPRSTGNLETAESGTYSGALTTVAIGDTLRIERTGTTIEYKKNGATFHTSATASSGAKIVDASLYNNGAYVDRLRLYGTSEGNQYVTPTDLVGVDSTALIIPRVPGTNNDALGNGCQFKGPAPNPGLYLSPVVTGDGAAVYVDCGSALIPASADYVKDIYYWHSSSTSIELIFSQYQSTTGDNGRYTFAANSNGVQNRLGVGIGDNTVVTLDDALVPNSWHHLRVTRSGAAFTIEVVNRGLSASGTYAGTSGIMTTSNSRLLSLNNASTPHYSTGRIGLVSITTGGVTKYVLPRGGSSRTVDVLGDDGSASTGTINGGSTSSIFANRGDGSWKDPRVEHPMYAGDGLESSLLSYDFGTDGNADGWTPGSAFVTVSGGVARFVSTGSDPQFTKTGLTFSGSANPIVAFRYRVLAGSPSNGGQVYYSTTSHGIIGSYFVTLPPLNSDGNWHELHTDMRNLSLGGNDWITSTIKAVRIDPHSNDSVTIEIDWIRIGPGIVGMIPAKLDDSQYADGTAIDTASTAHVPANKLGDPNAQIDRTGGNANTPFADDSAAPTAETTASDPNTTTSGKCRRRKTNNYVDRVGSSRYAQTDQLAEQFYGD